MTKTVHAEDQNGPNANRNDQNGPKVKWPYGDVKNVIIDKFLQILAVLVIRDVQKQFFTTFKILFIS